MDKRISAAVPSINELKKMLKKENLDSGRLTSLRLPRDLSLGGTKPKKEYKPNLNVVRNKDKNKHVPNKTDRGQKRPADHLTPPKRHNDKHVKYIQSESVFSQGMGERKLNNHRSDPYEHNHTAAIIPKPKYDKNSWNLSKSDVSMRNDLIDNDIDEDSDSDNEYTPVVLPLELNKVKFSRIYKLKSEDLNKKIKKENMDPETFPMCNGYDTKTDVKINVKTEDHCPFSDHVIKCDEDHLAFSILKLPTSFQGKVWKDDSNDKDLDYTFRDMPEGRLGKIVVRKSGKMEMIVKNTKYILSGGNTGNSLESLVLFPGDESIASVPSVVTLGQVSEKFSITPDWSDLFNRARKNKKFFW